jgi:hypothetical protein
VEIDRRSLRHFASKDALRHQHAHRLAEDARALVEAENAGWAFFAFVARVIVRRPAEVHAMVALSDSVLCQALNRLLTRARNVSAVRADIGMAELVPVLVGASTAVHCAGTDRTLRRRLIGVILDGMRPTPGQI